MDNTVPYGEVLKVSGVVFFEDSDHQRYARDAMIDDGWTWIASDIVAGSGRTFHVLVLFTDDTEGGAPETCNHSWVVDYQERCAQCSKCGVYSPEDL